MIYLVLSIIFNVLLAIIFREFAQHKIQNLPAIVVNYITCAFIGILFFQVHPGNIIEEGSDWIWLGVLIGALFILGFNVAAQTIQFYGIAYTSIFQKVSLVITVLFAILYFSEPFSALKGMGLVLAVLSILLINHRSKRLRPLKEVKMTWILVLPFLTFFLNGSIETLIYFAEASNRVEAGDFYFITCLFLVAGIIGSILLCIDRILCPKAIRRKDILGGIILGIPNFFSIHFFLKALSSGLGGSQVIPINNTGIILLSAIIGYFVFRERLTKMNIVGIICAIFSILMISG